MQRDVNVRVREFWIEGSEIGFGKCGYVGKRMVFFESKSDIRVEGKEMGCLRGITNWKFFRGMEVPVEFSGNQCCEIRAECLSLNEAKGFDGFPISKECWKYWYWKKDIDSV